MALFKKAPLPDSGAEYRRNMLANLAMPDIDALNEEMQLELENQMKDFHPTPAASLQSPEPSQTIPAGLIDSHLRQIKELSAQADEFEAEAKRLTLLVKEHRLGVKALEAANTVLQGGLPLASGLPNPNGIAFSADPDVQIRNSALEDKGER